jgi:hypothetical protein
MRKIKSIAVFTGLAQKKSKRTKKAMDGNTND